MASRPERESNVTIGVLVYGKTYDRPAGQQQGTGDDGDDSYYQGCGVGV